MECNLDVVKDEVADVWDALANLGVVEEQKSTLVGLINTVDNRVSELVEKLEGALNSLQDRVESVEQYVTKQGEYDKQELFTLFTEWYAREKGMAVVYGRTYSL